MPESLNPRRLIRPFLMTLSIFSASMTSGCGLFSKNESLDLEIQARTPPRVEVPQDSRQRCPLPSIPETGPVSETDLRTAYNARGTAIVECDGARAGAVEASDEEHRAEENWLKQVRERLRRRGG